MPEIILSVEHPDAEIIDAIIAAVKQIGPPCELAGAEVSLTVDGEDVP